MSTIKTITFDVDSTLTSIEGLVEIARMKDMIENVEIITQQGMNGEISFYESVTQRLNLIRPSETDLKVIGQMYIDNLVPGVEETIGVLKSHGVEIYLVSGSYTVSLHILAEYLGIPQKHVFGLELLFDRHGEYLGIDPKQLLLSDNGKEEVLRNQQYDRDLAWVGDGVTDMKASIIADTFIGFGGVTKRGIVRDNAEYYIEIIICKIY